MIRRLLGILALALPLVAVEKPLPPADLTTPPADAERMENGLITKKLAEGTGKVTLASEGIARVRVTVWKSDGTLVQHVPPPQTMVIGVDKMIPGWGLAAQQMVAGEKRRAWIPASLTKGKLKEGMLVIDTELVEIIEPPVVPPDVAAPPADAKKTESGLAYKALRSGIGAVHPKRTSKVVVHYTGWTTEGVMFDSSVLRGTPTEFALTQVIKGWTEGLQLMVEGEKTRFWIPAKLAYAGMEGPQGMLVFDIELIDIK